jgi:fatty-acyl-CoA synthase
VTSASAPTTWEGPDLEAAVAGHRLTLADFVLEVAAATPDRQALVFDDPLRGGATVSMTYAELAEASLAVAAELVRRGTGQGTRVGLLLGNRPEFVTGLFGIALAGGVAVALSTFSTPAELADLVARSCVDGVLTQSRLKDRPLGAEVAALVGDERLGFLRWSAEVDAPGFAPAPTPAERAVLAERRSHVEPGEPGLILFSSGTTSAPKGMVHVHRAPTAQFWLLADVFRRRGDSRVWAPLPLFWTAGLTTALGPTLAGGGCVVLQETFEAGEALRLLARERVTEPYTLPHQAAALVEHPDWEATDLSSLREVYGKSVFTRHPRVEGDPTWTMPIGFGMSETCAIVLTHRWSNTRAEMQASTGRLMPGVRLRVLDPDTRRPLGVDEDGELALAGPTVLDHYLGMTREETLVADGFLPTGDVGYVDAGGEVHWTGRRTEVIKTAGANVSPAELEFALRAHRGLKRTKVVGLPDDRLGEVVVLCAEPAEGAAPTAEELVGFLAERVASYKLPRHVVFFGPGEMPTTASDTKLRDDELIAMVAERLAAG